jgi:Ca2+-binding EF-hand superfamily protein
LIGQLFAGCGRSKPPLPSLARQAKATSASVKEKQPEQSTQVEADAAPAAAEQPPSSDGKAGTASDSAQADQVQRSTPPPPVRLAVLLSGGPLVVDIRLSVDGEDPAAGLDALVQQVLAAGDTNQDGVPTWDELADNTRFRYGPLVRAGRDSETEARDWKQRFDIDRKGWIERAEARAWLGRNAGRTAKAISLDSSRSRYYEPRWHSRVWRLIDADSDGLLSSAEMKDAPARLLARDADDDRIVYPHDLDALRDQVRAADGMASTTSSRSEADLRAALFVSPEEDWHLISAILCDQYAFGQHLGPDSFQHVPDLFERLDSDASGRVSPSELAELTSIEPHLALCVDFRSAMDSEARFSTLDLVTPPREEVVHVVDASPARLTLALADEVVHFSVHDLVPRQDFEGLAAEQLAALDADTNGYLEEKELEAQQPGGPERLLVLDADGNGMVVADEIAEYLRLEQAVDRSQIHVSVHNRGDLLFGQLDTDQDGRLGEREVATAQEHLIRLDGNSDGELSDNEVGAQMSVRLVRGNLPSGEAQYDLPPASAPVSDIESPDWFTRGDFNGDHDISRREFLGTAEQFAEVDADGDGYLTATEAAAVGQ